MADGRLDEGKSLLDRALELSVAARSMRNLSLILAAFSELALARGYAERAALMIGGAEACRRWSGQRSWPILRRREEEAMNRMREALGTDRFEEVYAAGIALSMQEAVAIASDTQAPGMPASRAG